MSKKQRKLWKWKKAKCYPCKAQVAIICLGTLDLSGSKAVSLFRPSQERKPLLMLIQHYQTNIHAIPAGRHYPAWSPASKLHSFRLRFTKLSRPHYMSLLSDVSETEKLSASHSICANRCYSLGNYCRHLGLSAYLQYSCHWVQWNLDFFGWRKLGGRVLKPFLQECWGLAKLNNFHHFFCSEPQTSPSRHFLYINCYSPMPDCTVNGFWLIWKLLLLKREHQISSNAHENCEKTLQLWSGQSCNLSKKPGKGNRNYC